MLIVDDQPDAADMLAEALTARGHDARVAYDGASALALAATFAPELAIVDLTLPDMDGCDLARRLRDVCRAKLVSLSGHDSPADRRRTAEAGFAEHLRKPATIRQLAQLAADLHGAPSGESG